jgi:hypothetical protein
MRGALAGIGYRSATAAFLPGQFRRVIRIGDARPSASRRERSQRGGRDRLQRQVVSYATTASAGTIIIDTAQTYLYYVLGDGKAIRYGIGVGRDGFTWSGAQAVTRMAEWPDWTPPQEMIARQPYLPRWMAGGQGNPLVIGAVVGGPDIARPRYRHRNCWTNHYNERRCSKGVGRFLINGPDIGITSGAVIALAMTFNELCTNTTKFGALSVPEGRVEVAWTVEDEQRFQLTWTEIDGPTVPAPTRRSFGTRMIGSLGQQLHGEVKLAYEPAGFVYTLNVPLTSLTMKV